MLSLKTFKYPQKAGRKDATHRRLVEKLRMCKNSLNIGL